MIKRLSMTSDGCLTSFEGEMSMVEAVDKPLAGIVVLDFSQFLAGPVAAMRLADLGARVIKIERPGSGDIGRTLAFAGSVADEETVSFHAMNRNKEGMTADLKDPDDLVRVKDLIRHADAIVENFRPGVMERLGLDYESVKEINPRLVYASATGFGGTGPWKDRPGQDLLAQSMSGLPWLNGSREQGPVPVGLSIADHLTSCHIAQGITALLVRRARTGLGGRVETSLLESMLDLQFELLSVHLNEPDVTVQRGGEHSAHAFLSAPYGTYPTSDGHIALAMNPLAKLGELLEINELRAFSEEDAWSRRSEAEDLLAKRLATATSAHWLEILDAADVWCAPVLTLEQLVAHEGFAAIEMVQKVERSGSLTRSGEPLELKTTRSPIRVDGHVLVSDTASPKLGQHDARLSEEFGWTGAEVTQS